MSGEGVAVSRLAIRHRSAATAATLTMSAALAVAGTSIAGAQAAGAHPAKSTKWTRISTNTSIAGTSPGLLRTADGRLHVVWPGKDGSQFSLHYSTVGGRAHLLASGVIVKKWSGVSFYPRLVPGPKGGIRMIFTGGDGSSGPFSTGAMYIADSNSAGKSWTLVNGSLSRSKLVPLTDTAASTEPNGTPVAAWGVFTALDYHVGIDPNTPAKSPDSKLVIGTAGGLEKPTLIRTKSGTILAGWFDSEFNAKQGYWAAQIWPTRGTHIKAPGSGGHNNQANGQPHQPVALVARQGGGNYFAYCVPTKSLTCGHIALWRVGAAK